LASPTTGDTYYIAYSDTVSANLDYNTFSTLVSSQPNWRWAFKSRVWQVQNLGTSYGGSIDYSIINNDFIYVYSTSPVTVYVGFSIPIDVNFFAKNNIWITDGTYGPVFQDYNFPFFSGTSFTTNFGGYRVGSDTNIYASIILDSVQDYTHITSFTVTTYDFANSTPIDGGVLGPNLPVIPYSATSAINYYNTVVDAWVSKYVECNDPSEFSSASYYYVGNFPSPTTAFDSQFGGECFTFNTAMAPFSGTPSTYYTDLIENTYVDCPTCEASVDHLDIYYHKVGTDCSGNTLTPELIFTATTSQIDTNPWGVTAKAYVKLNYSGGDICINQEGTWSVVSAQTTNATLINLYSNCTNCANNIPITPSPTPTFTVTPSYTPTNTPTETETPTPTPTFTQTPTETETPTPTPTFTQTPTETETPTPTPTFTQTPTETETPTPTPTFTLTQTITQTLTSSIGGTLTPTETETPTPTPTFTQTPTETETPTPTPTFTLTQTITQTPTSSIGGTLTPTETETPTPTPTPTYTPTPSPTEPYDVYLFSSCCDGSLFRFEYVSGTLNEGDTYIISSSLDFTGCATILPYAATGPLYSASGVVFTNSGGDCTVCEGFSPCPSPTPTMTPTITQTPTLTVTESPTPTPTITETPTNTPTPSVTPTMSPTTVCDCVEYTLVNTSDVIVAEVQYIDCLYNDQQIELSPFESTSVCACQGSVIYPLEVTVTLDGDCPPIPSQTRTPNPTATPTPTNVPCTEDDFCLYTQLSSLQTYNGNYVSGGTYNSRPYFVGDGTTTGYIFYNGSYWCLSDSLGGPCYLQGAFPCNSPCPDISANFFTVGPCPTPTPSPLNCNTLDFNAYFDCDYVPYPTPSPSIDCDLLDLNVTSFPVSPTPTPSTPTCDTGIGFYISGYTEPTASPTPSPTIEPTRTVDVGGQVTYRFIDNTFVCVGSKVLLDCTSGLELYTSDPLVYSGTPLVAGTYFLGNIAGQYFCLQYLRDDDTFSANVSIDSVLDIYGNCVDCQVVLTPTPSITPTNTPTPSITPTATVTPSSTFEAAPVYYVFETCSLNSSGNPSAVISQTVPVNFAINVGQSFKDPEDQCWKYLGAFTSYYPQGNTNYVTYNTNYFNITPVVYGSCELCIGGQPTPVNCVRYTDELYRTGRPDGCGGYTAEESRVTVTLYDSTGNIVVNASTNITVVFDIQVNDCLGTTTETLTVTVPQGLSSGFGVYTSFNNETCPVTALCDTVTKSVQGIASITPSTVTEC
jgi:hypothetical protein